MKTVSATCLSTLSAVCAAALLSACGGGSEQSQAVPTAAAPPASEVTTLQLDLPALPEEAGVQSALPAFHVAPVLLEAPDDEDALQNDASARRAPRKQALPPESEGMTTRRLTVETLKLAREKRLAVDQATVPDGSAAPMASGGVVATYTPAQVRAAYGLPALPAVGTALSASQAALLGAGQTIYVVDARHNPNVAAELAAFNTKFGLPACTTKAIATSASLPLASASASACELSVVYANASGGMAATAPAFDAGWATEIALDVQWAHATAPLARIVLIEVPDPSLNSLLGGIKLANAMGPGIVSMSFGALEGTWTASVDAVFSSSKMTYLAAAGDSGSAVSWPAVSPNVVAVGGTTLTYSGSGARSEVSWSKTGGGTSAYTQVPSYQTNAVPGMGTVTRRNVPDVAFNADPTTGQYVAVMTPGSTAVNWVSAGGTSLSTPQWAGLVAVANAVRNLSSKASLGAPHSVLYSQIASVPGTYASSFADITKGANGSCSTCTARTGYDPLTGLGTPNASSLLSALTGASTPLAAPVVTPGSITGKPGVALSFAVTFTAPNPVSYGLSGAPSGMAISSTGVVTWANPVLGSYTVTVTAKDSKTGLSGQGVYSVKIATAGPVITAPAMIGVAGKPLTGTISISDPGATSMSVSLSNVPLGMSFTVSGSTLTAYWPSPKTGSYTMTVSVLDSAGLSAKATVPITVNVK